MNQEQNKKEKKPQNKRFYNQKKDKKNAPAQNGKETKGGEGKQKKQQPARPTENKKPRPQKNHQARGGAKHNAPDSRAEKAARQTVNRENKKERQSKARDRKKPTGKLRIIPLGGLMEIGKNMTAIEYENDIIVVDCGFAFPDEEMLGVDYVIPDISYLEKNKDRVRGILITHGHEDHIGAIPYVLRSLNPPIYSTRLALGIIRNKLAEHKLPEKPRLLTVEAGDEVQLGAFLCEFIHVNHSIADACALAIHTPLGVIYHSGDFKLDVTPIDGQITTTHPTSHRQS